MKISRLTIFAGHYGSGKTSLAISYAAYLKRLHKHVAVADLDIVNPYFRANDGADYLKSLGIQLITTEYAGTNLEAPAVSAGVAAIFDNRDLFGVIDLGGDDRGAYAIGRYSGRISDEPEKNILLVINKYRPLTKTPEAVAEIRYEIEGAAGFKFTGIVNNSNLGQATTAKDILTSTEYAGKSSKLTGLPIAMTSVQAGLYEQLTGVANLFKMDNLGAVKHGDSKNPGR